MGQATTMQVVLTDNCQNPVTGANNAATVSISFSNGDQSLSMKPYPSPVTGQLSGTWQGSWTPHNPATANVVTLHVIGQEPLSLNNFILGGTEITANVGSSSATQQPIIKPGAIVNAASFQPGLPVSPGALITIFGSGLASSTAPTTGLPLPTTLGGAQVTLAGQPLPLLYASDGQLNAQVPSALPLNGQPPQIQVIRSNVPSVPDTVAVAAAVPAVFTTSQTGTGQGAITDVNAVLKDANSPATAGSVIVIYCTGLGQVSPAVPDGQPASSSPLSVTVNPVSVTVGGVSAQVLFAGLAPGFAGLYQVNAVMPSGIPTGNAAVILTVAGQVSPPVTIAVH
jgi:adhesin/invasin